jgi:hypothetical protein
MTTNRWPFGQDLRLLRAVEDLRRLEDAVKLPAQYLEMETSLRAMIGQATQPVREIAERMSKDRALLEQYANATTQFSEHVRALQQSAAVQGVLNSFNETRSLIEGLARHWDDSPVAKALEQLQLQTQSLLDIDWDRLRTRHEAALTFASDNGWFMQPEHDVDLPFAIEDCDGDVDSLDALFLEAVASTMSDIHARVARDFPTRQHIVDEAFKLYGEERYISAVPLMLLVADGIAHDRANKSAYSVRRKQTTLADWVAKLEVGPAIWLHAKQLANPHQLSRSGHRGLSRHGVLHGTDPSYGTRTNCLKAASFLGFIAWLMAENGPADLESDDDASN